MSTVGGTDCSALDQIRVILDGLKDTLVIRAQRMTAPLSYRRGL